MTHRLEARDLRKGFGGLMAVAGVSAIVQTGDVLGVVGPNGAGKTTLFNLMAGALRPDAGDVILDGVTLTGLPAHMMARHGVVRTFQEARIFPHLTVLENVIAYIGRGHGGVGALLTRGWGAGGKRGLRDAALAGLELVDMRDLADARAGDLPFGLQRMLSVARAIAAKPAVLLLDEPMAGLAENEVHRLADLVRSVAAGGTAVMIIDHNIDEIATICDRLVVMHNGCVLRSGSTREVLDDEAVLSVYLGSG